jgi:hypothetical protein
MEQDPPRRHRLPTLAVPPELVKRVEGSHDRPGVVALRLPRGERLADVSRFDVVEVAIGSSSE